MHTVSSCVQHICIGIVDEPERSDLGVTIGGKWCKGLLYADDITFLADTGAELQLY